MPTDHQSQHRPARTRRRTGRRVLAAAAAVVLAGTLAACGGGDSDTSGNTGGLEKSTITVGLLPIPDAAPLFVAIQQGLFKKEGLTVKTEIVQSGVAAVPLLKSGKLDISLAAYVPALTAQEQSNGAVQWHFVADSYQGEKGAFVVMVAPDSPIRNPQDLKGKTIAVPALKSIGTLTITATLRIHGMNERDVKFTELAFPLMPDALKAKRIDAAWMAEPFISAMQKQGARTVLDTVDPSGPTGKIPVAGWGVLGDYAKKNPKTVAAFQRAMAKAQQMAATDRNLVARTLPTYVKGIDASTAQIVTLGSFPTGQNPTRLKRLADMMGLYGYLKEPAKIDINSMIVPGPAS